VTRLLARSNEQTAASKRTGNHVSREGNNPTVGESSEHQVVRSLFATDG